MSGLIVQKRSHGRLATTAPPPSLASVGGHTRIQADPATSPRARDAILNCIESSRPFCVVSLSTLASLVRLLGERSTKLEHFLALHNVLLSEGDGGCLLCALVCSHLGPDFSSVIGSCPGLDSPLASETCPGGPVRWQMFMKTPRDVPLRQRPLRFTRRLFVVHSRHTQYQEKALGNGNALAAAPPVAVA